MRVLIVEDELRLAGLLRRGLVEEGHAADVAANGSDALWMARATPSTTGCAVSTPAPTTT